MNINLDQIKHLITSANLAEVSRETGIPYRTLQAYKLQENNWLADTIEKLTKLQTYINKEENTMENFTVVGKWWNDKNIELVKIEGEGIFALHGWNGEKYTSCWKVDENDLTKTLDGEYTITPEYAEVAEDEFEVTTYYVEEN